jgi:predicted tellurium resistance membrane protein TerC
LTNHFLYDIPKLGQHIFTKMKSSFKFGFFGLAGVLLVGLSTQINASYLIPIGIIALTDCFADVDNVIALSSFARQADKKYYSEAMLIGIAMGFILQIIILWFAPELIESTSIFGYQMTLFGAPFKLFMFLCGAYLVFLGSSHVLAEAEHADENGEHVDDKFRFKELIQFFGTKGFLPLALNMGINDLAFSLENLGGALAISKIFIVLVIGILIAKIVVAIGAEPISKFVEDRPALKQGVFIYIFLVGIKLICDCFNVIPELNELQTLMILPITIGISYVEVEFVRFFHRVELKGWHLNSASFATAAMVASTAVFVRFGLGIQFVSDVVKHAA